MQASCHLLCCWTFALSLTVDHEIFMDVFRNRFGIEQKKLKSVHSYGCSQTFKKLDNSSGPVSLICSILQGTRIGSHKFTVYLEGKAGMINSFNNQHRTSLSFQLFTRVLPEFHNIIGDWSFALGTLKAGVHLRDFS